MDLVLQDFEVLGFDVSGDIDARGAFAHLGFDEDLSLLACHGDAVMAVHHEVDLSHLVEDDRREADQTGLCGSSFLETA